MEQREQVIAHRDALAELLRETARAHHAAFAAQDGADPDWPIWYAGHLRDALAGRFGIELTQSQLVYCLIKADAEHKARAPAADWAKFYAGEFLEHYSLAHGDQDRLALYYLPSCPFCVIVLRAIRELGIEVERRDISQNPAYRDELVAARGRATVPVLRITSPDGEERWMPESRDIVHYLQKTFG